MLQFASVVPYCSLGPEAQLHPLSLTVLRRLTDVWPMHFEISDMAKPRNGDGYRIIDEIIDLIFLIPCNDSTAMYILYVSFVPRLLESLRLASKILMHVGPSKFGLGPESADICSLNDFISLVHTKALVGGHGENVGSDKQITHGLQWNTKTIKTLSNFNHSNISHHFTFNSP